ncbi:hypothetical protein [Clostridium perfringens]|uniref:hypothetical protein n=1 Tax=Clostridium perfringens TaxID=1502 RepID=UPI00111D9041|nr:hypothetical protein [Clostridium perfringens]TPE20462.1 hypothetical protein FJM09_03330 [Clostridium perfringens]
MSINNKYPIFIGGSIYKQEEGLYKLITISGIFLIRSSSIITIIDKFKHLNGQISLSELKYSELDREHFKKLVDLSMIILIKEKMDIKNMKTFLFLSKYLKEPEFAIEKIYKTSIKITDTISIRNIKDSISEIGINKIEEFTLEDLDLDKDDIYISISYKNDKLLQQINRKVISSGAIWVPIIIQDEYVEFGPIINNPETACFECMNFIKQENYESEFIYNSFTLTCALEYKIKGILTDILLQIICNYRKETLWGKVLKMNYDTEKINIYKVLKLSNCIACQNNTYIPLKRWEYEL